jgi:hypothetical protein
MNNHVMWVKADGNRMVRDQEAKSRKREERQRDRLERLEAMVYAQHEKLDRLEDLVYRVMHRGRVSVNKDLGHPGDELRSPPTRSGTEATRSNPEGDEMDDPSSYSQTMHKETIATTFYPIPNI